MKWLIHKILPQNYLKMAFHWQTGRQGSGYDKMLLLSTYFPIAFDSYLSRSRVGSFIKPYIAPVTDKKHYRLNVILKKSQSGG